MQQEKISEAILILGKAYNKNSERDVEHAIQVLKQGLSSQENRFRVVRADQITDEFAPFYGFNVPWLDTLLGGGMRRKELLIIGGLPETGKTHIMTWMGARLLEQGAKVIYFVGEDLLPDIQNNFATAVNGHRALLNNLWLADMNMSFRASDVERILDDLKSKNIVFDIVIVDHIDLMQPGSKHGGDWQDASSVVEDLKFLAKRENMIFISASQLIKYSDGGGQQRLRLYRAEVGKRGHADVMLFFERLSDFQYLVMREKSRGRRVTWDTRQIQINADWNKMFLEAI